MGSIGRHLRPGGWLLVSTDVLELARSARATIREAAPADLRDMVPDAEDFSASRPAELGGVSTERERASEALGRPVYRMVFRRGAREDF